MPNPNENAPADEQANPNTDPPAAEAAPAPSDVAQTTDNTDPPAPPNDDDTSGIEPDLDIGEAALAEPVAAETPPTNLPSRPSGTLPIYQCHKQVVAIEIAGVEEWRPGEYIITPKDEGAHPFEVPAHWFDHHKPQVGGYVVVYADGYMSFSPRGAFLDGYTLVGTHSTDTSTTQPGQGEGFGAT